ncbi:MAG: hypothetical protein H0W83_18555 [Planctomycetes bacterium]|nr:hypothetical protein [Planctomycetota bacterium]
MMQGPDEYEVPVLSPTSSHRASIHPSIDGLVAMIAAKTMESPKEENQLREMCRKKIRSYREDVYMKRYTTVPDVAAARDRWQIVTAFANRRDAPER